MSLRLRFEPRLRSVGAGEIALRIAFGVVLALAAGGLVIAMSGHDPVTAYQALFRGGFGSRMAFEGTLNKAVPIGLCALGIALASRAQLTNIGGEGQFYFGAFTATAIGLALPEATPGWIAIPAVLIAGIIGGGFWALIAAVPKALFGVSEILSTLMLNYICMLWVGYLVRGPWADPMAYSFPYSPPIIDNAQMMPLFGSVHGGLFLLLAATLGLALVDRGSRWGYELRVSGDAPEAARYGGISATAVVISALCFSGAMAGLAGAVELSTTGRLQLGLSPGYGFMGILVAWLAGGRAVPILIVSIFYAGLLNGGFSLQVSRVPSSISTILQALILIFVLAAVTLSQYRLRIYRSEAHS
ncbi:ABC transporter permease [Xanthobacter sp. ZOL 2024]